MPFDADNGAVQRAVGFVVLEEEDCGTRRDRIVIADGGGLPRGGDVVVVALVEPNNSTCIRIGEEVGVRQKLPNRAQCRSVVGRYGDEDVGMEVEKCLAAAAARRDEAATLISGGGDCDERASSRCCCGTEYDELGARSAGEMVDVDRLMDPAGRVHRRCGYGVVRVAPEGSSEPFRSLDYTALGVEKLHGDHDADPRSAQPHSSTQLFQWASPAAWSEA